MKPVPNETTFTITPTDPNQVLIKKRKHNNKTEQQPICYNSVDEFLNT